MLHSMIGNSLWVCLIDKQKRQFSKPIPVGFRVLNLWKGAAV